MVHILIEWHEHFVQNPKPISSWIFAFLPSSLNRLRIILAKQRYCLRSQLTYNLFIGNIVPIFNFCLQIKTQSVAVDRQQFRYLRFGEKM